MWASAFYLVIGNAVIGVFEGVLLAKLFHLRKGKTIAWLIPANYFSAWLGGVVIAGGISSAVHVDLYNARTFLWLMIALTYVLTLLLEFPFVALAFWRDPQWLRKAIHGSLVVQTASYVLLLGWFWAASGTSLLTNVAVVQPSAFSLPNDVVLYFIDSEDGNVCKMNLATLSKQEVFDLRSTNPKDQLDVTVSASDEARWDLCALLATEKWDKPHIVKLPISLNSVAVREQGSVHAGWKSAGRLGTAKGSDWEFTAGAWAAGGLSAHQKKTGAHVAVAYETPFGQWLVRNPTHLPTDKVVFQLGVDQICVFDPVTRQIALVAKGRGPVAVLEGNDVPATPQTAK